MKRWFYFLLALLIFAIVHEGMHAITAFMFGEFHSFHVRPYGLEVVFQTPVSSRSGIQWAIISGSSNVLTLLIGYLLFLLRGRFINSKSGFWKAFSYYATFLFLLLDALNLSVGPFFYGGDANGISVGLGINRLIIQAFFFIVLMINRELIASKLVPLYKVYAANFLLQPWFINKTK